MFAPISVLVLPHAAFHSFRLKQINKMQASDSFTLVNRILATRSCHPSFAIRRQFSGPTVSDVVDFWLVHGLHNYSDKIPSSRF